MLENDIINKAISAKNAGRILYSLSTAKKNALLKSLCKKLEENTDKIILANNVDLNNAKQNGLSKVLLDRLTLNQKRIKQMINGVKDIIKLKDPVGITFEKTKRPNGLIIEKMRVPIGVIGIIYEARPNVTIDAATLCLKSGNAVILKGGSEALNTNKLLVDIIKLALSDVSLPLGCVEFVDTTDREAVNILIKQDKYIDLIIPRGSQQLIRFIQEHSSVPIISHGEGNCHVFVDKFADLKMAEKIVINAKTQRPAVCNAAEKLLVHKNIAEKFLPSITKQLKMLGVEIRGDNRTQEIVNDVILATEDDWHKEYLDLIIAIKIVDDIDSAIEHVNIYGSHHSDAIVTSNIKNGEKFLRLVDSAAVYVNASTRFTDGFEFGMGAEIGNSTQKLHARGPMGLVELTSTKYIVHGKGQLRS